MQGIAFYALEMKVYKCPAYILESAKAARSAVNRRGKGWSVSYLHQFVTCHFILAEKMVSNSSESSIS